MNVIYFRDSRFKMSHMISALYFWAIDRIFTYSHLKITIFASLSGNHGKQALN